jgi:hypothetical protein
MPEPQLVDQLVTALYLQSLAFGLSWAIAYFFGHRFKIAHWLVSVLFLAAIEGGSAWTLQAMGGGAPSRLA